MLFRFVRSIWPALLCFVLTGWVNATVAYGQGDRLPRDFVKQLECAKRLEGWKAVEIGGEKFKRVPAWYSLETSIHLSLQEANLTTADLETYEVQGLLARVHHFWDARRSAVKYGPSDVATSVANYRENSEAFAKIQARQAPRVIDGVFYPPSNPLSEAELDELGYLMLESAAYSLDARGVPFRLRTGIFGKDGWQWAIGREALEIEEAGPHAPELARYLRELDDLAQEANRLSDERSRSLRRILPQSLGLGEEPPSRHTVSLVFAPGQQLRDSLNAFHKSGNWSLFQGMPAEVIADLDPARSPSMGHEKRHLLTSLRRIAGVPDALDGYFLVVPTSGSKPGPTDAVISRGLQLTGYGRGVSLDEPDAQLEGVREAIDRALDLLNTAGDSAAADVLVARATGDLVRVVQISAELIRILGEISSQDSAQFSPDDFGYLFPWGDSLKRLVASSSPRESVLQILPLSPPVDGYDRTSRASPLPGQIATAVRRATSASLALQDLSLTAKLALNLYRAESREGAFTRIELLRLLHALLREPRETDRSGLRPVPFESYGKVTVRTLEEALSLAAVPEPVQRRAREVLQQGVQSVRAPRKPL